MATKWVPFTAYLKVYPKQGKRFEYIRSLQRIANLMYEELDENTSLSIVTPGGGQHRSYSGYQKGGMGGMAPGCAIKPQFGNTPAQVVVTGFYNAETEVAPQYSSMQIISGGEVHEGYNKHLYDANPTTATATEAKSLRTSIEDSLNDLPSDIDYIFFRLDYGGIIYGDHGIGFPQ